MKRFGAGREENGKTRRRVKEKRVREIERQAQRATERNNQSLTHLCARQSDVSQSSVEKRFP